MSNNLLIQCFESLKAINSKEIDNTMPKSYTSVHHTYIDLPFILIYIEPVTVNKLSILTKD